MQTPKTIHLLYDDDSYEVVIAPNGRVLEVWRFRQNQTAKPEFVNLEWLDYILQDRIQDRIMRLYEETDFP